MRSLHFLHLISPRISCPLLPVNVLNATIATFQYALCSLTRMWSRRSGAVGDLHPDLCSSPWAAYRRSLPPADEGYHSLLGLGLLRCRLSCPRHAGRRAARVHLLSLRLVSPVVQCLNEGATPLPALRLFMARELVQKLFLPLSVGQKLSWFHTLLS